MTSSINPSVININYPIAGISQSSQPFRDNYRYIQNLFDVAKNEISSLQSSLANLSSSATTTINGLSNIYVKLAGSTMSGILQSTGFIGPLTGNASTSSKWASTMLLSTSGDAIGSTFFDGSITTTIALTLKNVGTSGTYTKVITDAQGRIISGTTLSSNDVNNALGYIPVNKAGDTMSGILFGTAFRAIQGSPTAGSISGTSIYSSDYSTNGYAFGTDGDTGIFSPIVVSGSLYSNGVVSIFCNGIETLRSTQYNITLYQNLLVAGTTTLGTATGITVSSSDNSINLATTAFVQSVAGSIAGSAVGAITGAMIDAALGYTPYNISNPANYINSAAIPTLISTFVNDSGYIKGTTITGTQVDAALGYTPVNDGGDTINGSLVITGNLTVIGTITDANDVCHSETITSSIYTITGSYLSYCLTINADTSISFNVPTDTVNSKTLTILLIGDGTHNATFSSSIIWDLGVVQPMNISSGKHTLYTFMRFPNISSWLGGRAVYEA